MRLDYLQNKQCLDSNMLTNAPRTSVALAELRNLEQGKHAWMEQMRRRMVSILLLPERDWVDPETSLGNVIKRWILSAA